MDVTKFEELQLDDRIIRAITEMGFEEASPIQAQAIPVVSVYYTHLLNAFAKIWLKLIAR